MAPRLAIAAALLLLCAACGAAATRQHSNAVGPSQGGADQDQELLAVARGDPQLGFKLYTQLHGKAYAAGSEVRSAAPAARPVAHTPSECCS